MNNVKANAGQSAKAHQDIWAIWFVLAVLAWIGLLWVAYLVACSKDNFLGSFLSDGPVNGFLQWIGLFGTGAGFWLAWVQLRQLKTETQAVAVGMDRARFTFHATSAVSTLKDALYFLTRMDDAVRQQEWPLAAHLAGLIGASLIRLEYFDKGFDGYATFLAAFQGVTNELTTTRAAMSPTDVGLLRDATDQIQGVLQPRLNEAISSMQSL